MLSLLAVSSFFSTSDKTQFIEFPTSRLEMDKVADLFDKGDGLINSKEFINALRFDIANVSPCLLLILRLPSTYLNPGH